MPGFYGFFLLETVSSSTFTKPTRVLSDKDSYCTTEGVETKLLSHHISLDLQINVKLIGEHGLYLHYVFMKIKIPTSQMVHGAWLERAIN